MSKKRTKKTIGQKIRARRLAADLRIPEVIRRLHAWGCTINEKTLRRWEADENAPDSDHTEALRAVLNVRGI